MKTQVNSPVASKINFTAGVQSAANIGVYLAASNDYLPESAVVDALVLANIAAAGLIFVFRTWFTRP